MAPNIAVETLGSLRIRQGEDTLAQLPLKARALLAYLAVTGRPHSRSSLATLLWGEMPEERARANLRLALSALRSETGELLDATRQEVRFAPNAEIWCDAIELAGFPPLPGAVSTDELRSALILYRGDFLADLDLPDTPEFHEWALVERERLQQTALSVALELGERQFSTGEINEAKPVFQKGLEIAPWSEECHRGLIRILADQGERSLALAQYEQCCRILMDEFGVEPDEQTQALYQELRAGNQPPARPATQPGATASPTPIPTPLTAFIGREAELDELDDLIRPGRARLVTLLGSGGSGKTRLALAALERYGDRFPDGAVFVPLASGTPASEVEAATMIVTGIAQALGLRFDAHQPPHESLAAHLANSQMLIVLDNAEQLVSGGAMLRWLLERAPGLTITATSRERPGVIGEHIVDVNGLPYPASQFDNPEEFDAVQLFVARARAGRADIEVTSALPAIADLCRQVEGHPLAIELAANWVRLLSIDEIAARVRHDLDILAAHDSGIPERHRSIRAVLDQTSGLLDDESRRLLYLLSVFRGGWDVNAAEQIAGARLSQLSVLVDRSLVTQNISGRFDLHELVRQYAAGKLAEDPPLETAALMAHARYFTGFLGERQPLLAAIPDRQALAELDRESGNLRAAWDFLSTGQMPEVTALFIEHYWLYFSRRGRYQDIVSLLSRALDLPDLTHIQQVRWRRWLGETYYQMGTATEAEELLCDCLRIAGDVTLPGNERIPLRLVRPVARQSIHRLVPYMPRHASPQTREVCAECARALDRLGQLAFLRIEMNRALAATLHSLNFAERAGNPPDLARGYGTCALVGSMIPARRLSRMYYRLAEQTLPQVDDPETRAYVLELLALCSISSGEWEAATHHLDEAVEIFGQMRLQRFLAETMGLLARIAHWTGKLERTRELWDTVWHAGTRSGDPLATQWGLVGIVETSLQLGDMPVSRMLGRLDQVDDIECFDASEIACFHGAKAASLLKAGHDEQALVTIRAGLELLRDVKAPLVFSLPGYDLMLDTLIKLESRRTPTGQATRELIEVTSMLKDFARIHPIAEPTWQRGQGYIDHWQGRDPAARHAWQSGLRAAERLRMPFERAHAHRDLARIEEGDLAALHLRRARDILAGIGAAGDRYRFEVGATTGSRSIPAQS